MPGPLHRWAQSIARDERGAAVVEFAIVVPILMLLVLGIIDFGRMLAVSGGLAAAVRDGTRAAAVASNPSDATQQTSIKNRVITSFQPLGGAALQASNIAVSSDATAGTVTVTVTGYIYQPLTPVFRMVGAGTLSFTRTATFRWERSNF